MAKTKKTKKAKGRKIVMPKTKKATKTKPRARTKHRMKLIFALDGEPPKMVNLQKASEAIAEYRKLPDQSTKNRFIQNVVDSWPKMPEPVKREWMQLSKNEDVKEILVKVKENCYNNAVMNKNEQSRQEAIKLSVLTKDYNSAYLLLTNKEKETISAPWVKKFIEADLALQKESKEKTPGVQAAPTQKQQVLSISIPGDVAGTLREDLKGELKRDKILDAAGAIEDINYTGAKEAVAEMKKAALNEKIDVVVSIGGKDSITSKLKDKT